ncbi:MAG TPA: ABC transporter permease [Solirubrobacteraceae bacterium]|nr:ABC transporter permease [Solirubrobacteraceae bacterium]
MSAPAVSLTPPRLRPGDLARLATIGVRTRRLRAALSALGIAIGVAAIVAVLGISSSSQAGLLAEINQLGTNLLDVTTGQNFSNQAVPLPLTAPGMIGRIGPVYDVAYVGALANVNAYRSPLIPSVETNALSVAASNLNLPGAVGTSVAQGRFLNAGTASEPVCVLGAAAARRLGIDRLFPGERIWVGGMWFYVGGILKPAALAPEVDDSVLIGFPAAKTYLGYASVVDGHPTVGNPTEIYVRAETSQVNAVYNVLASTANPENPNEVDVTEPSSTLTAEADTKGAFNGLFLGLGAIALLVGAIGVANIMVISVLERRSEIGLRRALGATKTQIRTQFLTEAILLALIGGATGIGAGALATAIYAHTKHWTTVIPALAWGGGIGAAILIGAVAGIVPAIRAARLSPTDALRTA